VHYLYFDVDGTVVNTRHINHRAYLEAGVTMPDHAWGLPWEAWLIDYFNGNVERARAAHRAKVDRYGSLLMRYDPKIYELPAARIARVAMLGGHCVRYLTAGTATTAHAALGRLGISSQLHGGLTYEMRLEHLRRAPLGAIYLDDNLDTITQLAADVPTLGLVAITNQTYDELAYEVRRCRAQLTATT
jgi:hypothetical protein